MDATQPPIDSVQLPRIELARQNPLTSRSQCMRLACDERSSCMTQFAQAEKDHRVAEKRRMLFPLVRLKDRAERLMPVCDRAQDLPLGAGDSVGRRRELLQMTDESIMKKWQRRGLERDQLTQRHGIR